MRCERPTTRRRRVPDWPCSRRCLAMQCVAPSPSRRHRPASLRSKPPPDRSGSSAPRRRACSASALRNRRRRQHRVTPRWSARPRDATRASSAGSNGAVDRAVRYRRLRRRAHRRRDRRRTQSPSGLRRSPALRSVTRPARLHGGRHRARLQRWLDGRRRA